MVDNLHNNIEPHGERPSVDASEVISLNKALHTSTESQTADLVESPQEDTQKFNEEIQLSKWQRARVWLAEQFIKFAPELTRPIYTRLAGDRESQLALIRETSRDSQVNGLALVETLNIRETEDVLSIAKPFIEKGPEAVLKLIEEADVQDSNLRTKLACLSAAKHPADTLSNWQAFDCNNENSQRDFFDSILPQAAAVAVQALNEMPVTSKELRESIRLQAVETIPAIVLDSIKGESKDDCVAILLKAFTSNRTLVIERLHSLPISQSYKEDLLKEAAFHEPETVIEVISPQLVPDAETRKTLALLCGYGDAEATAQNVSRFVIEGSIAQEEVALHLAQRNGAATAPTLASFPELDTPALTRVVLRCLKSSWWGTVPHLGELPLTPRVRDEISAGAAERDAVRALQNIDSLKPENTQIYRSIVLNAARKDSVAALESVTDFSGFPYSLQKEFADHCAEQAPVALAGKLSELQLQIPEDHEELLDTCLRADFWETLRNIRHFSLSEDKRNSVLRRAVNKDVHKAALIAADVGASDVEILREVVTAYINSRTAEAANNKALWSAVPEVLRVEAARLAAPQNARAVAQGIRNFQISSEESRGEVFALCIERNVRDTVSMASDFELPQSILERFVEPLLRSPSPERDLEVLESLAIPPGSKLYVEAARQAIEASTRKFCDSFERYGITESEHVIELAALAAERNPSALLSNINKFPLPSENLFEVLVGCSGGNPKRAITLCNKFSIPYRGREAELALACAKHDVDRAFRWAEEKLGVQNPLSNEEVLHELFVASIHSCKITQSIKVCEQRLKLRDVHPTAQATIDLFDETIGSIANEQLRSETAREQVSLIKSLRRVQVTPNQSLLASLRHFKESQRGLLLGFLAQAGPSFGESILDTLRSDYPKNSEIADFDTRIVRDVIEGGFRGFSSDRLGMLREAYERSRVAGKRLLEEWSDISKSVLTGVGVSKAIRTSRQYVDYVIEAFRPSGMSRSEVKSYLGSVKDHSSRLNRFTYPREGYGMSLVSIENVSLKEGATLNEEALAQLGRTLQQVADTPASKRDFFTVLTRAAQRATGQVDKIKFLAYLTRQEASLDLGQKIQEISAELVRHEYSEKRAYQLLTDLQESLSSALEAALDSTVPPLIGTEGDDRDECFIPSQKHLKNIRRMLDLSAEDDVQKEDIAYALAQELGKVFQKDARMVSKELAKIDTGSGAAAGDFKMYMSLSQAAFFGRAGAGLCTARDTGSWNDKNYLQMMMVDTGRGRIVGNIQLHLFKNKDGQASVLARVNPTAKFVSKVDKEILAQEMLRVVQKFADDNNLIPYLPEQTAWHNLTNRNSFAPHLRAQYGRSESTSVRITRSHSVHKIYKMQRIALAA